MKFGKDEIQKMVLGTLFLVGLLYVYFNYMLGPLAAGEVRSKAVIADLQPQIASAQSQKKKTQNLELRAPVATQTLEQIKALIPPGSPIAWFPPRMSDFFKRQGILKCSTRMNGESPDKDLPGFREVSWMIELQKVEIVPLAAAIAALENSEPLLKINDIQVEANAGDPQYQHAVLTVSTLVNQ